MLLEPLPAAAAEVRKAVEELMNAQGVLVPKPGKFIGLRNRIAEFRKMDEKAADRLDAIAFIGNSGAHTHDVVQADVLDAYEILEHVLTHLYRVDGLSGPILASRGPVGPGDR